MLFNSLQFFVFFSVVYSLYLALNHKWQNRMLLLASCIFYAAWNWKFLFLMFFSISTDFVCSQFIARATTKSSRRFFLGVSLSVNLLILGFFKYFNFFVQNALDLLKFFGIADPAFGFALKIILPLGISFYTFEAISYVVDVYRGIIKPAQRYWDYVLFVIYFPHLIAGPIMRARDFIPQITTPRILRFDGVVDGFRLFFWGLFEKIFVADNLAKIVDPFFASSGPYTGSGVLFALYAFAFQIFCDFDGYSNMARGLGKCMGFEIVINFNLPYFATNPSEFWKRWHISLSSWLRDYLYIPLGGSRPEGGNKKGGVATYRNLMITMVLGGLWHGAQWTFVWWGCYHGILLVVYRLFQERRPQKEEESVPRLSDPWFLIRAVFFFHLVCLGWLLFRAQSMTQVFQMLSALVFDFDINKIVSGLRWELICIPILLTVQIFQYRHNDLTVMFRMNPLLRGLFYYACLILIIIFGVTGAQEFIYFQF